MMESLVAIYEKGAITPDHMVVQCLHMINPAAPELVLGLLPMDLFDRVLDFTKKYRPSMISSHGILPTIDQVEAARRWLERKRIAS
jgi:hypothetical protein